MASVHPHDRYLWLGFGIIAILAATGIRLALRDLLQLTKLDPSTYPPAAYDRRNGSRNSKAEDAMSIPTLSTLISSPNPHISRAATSLLVKRIQRSPAALASLRADLRNPDQNLRRRATRAMDFLRTNNPSFDQRTSHLPYRGIEYSDDLLEAVLPPESERTPAEHFVAQISARHRALRDGETARARDRTELTQNPWTIAEEDRDGGEDVVESIETDGTQLLANLTRARTHETPTSGEIGVASLTFTEAVNEMARRRQRREAMVLHEGDGRIGEADIFRPLRH